MTKPVPGIIRLVTTLREHREALAKNERAYVEDLDRVRKTAVAHLRRCGFARVTVDRCEPLIERFVEMIFATQDRKPFFHVDGVLPYCWNAPKNWDKNFIRYEWGHLRSVNQNADADTLENLCLQSARCNQHVQTSMDIDEVVRWLEGSLVAARVRDVLARRTVMFAGEEWGWLLEDLARYRR